MILFVHVYHVYTHHHSLGILIFFCFVFVYFFSILSNIPFALDLWFLFIVTFVFSAETEEYWIIKSVCVFFYLSLVAIYFLQLRFLLCRHHYASTNFNEILYNLLKYLLLTCSPFFCSVIHLIYLYEAFSYLLMESTEIIDTQINARIFFYFVPLALFQLNAFCSFWPFWHLYWYCWV